MTGRIYVPIFVCTNGLHKHYALGKEIYSSLKLNTMLKKFTPALLLGTLLLGTPLTSCKKHDDAATRAELTQVQSDLTKLKEQQQTSESRLSALEEQLTKLDQELSSIEEKLWNATEPARRQDLEAQRTKKQAERASLQKEADELRSALNQLKDRIAGLEERLARLEEAQNAGNSNTARSFVGSWELAQREKDGPNYKWQPFWFYKYAQKQDKAEGKRMTKWASTSGLEYKGLELIELSIQAGGKGYARYRNTNPSLPIGQGETYQRDFQYRVRSESSIIITTPNVFGDVDMKVGLPSPSYLLKLAEDAYGEKRLVLIALEPKDYKYYDSYRREDSADGLYELLIPTSNKVTYESSFDEDIEPESWYVSFTPKK